MKILQFQLNQSKQITIQQLTNELLNKNWWYKWYACRKNDCDDNTFYSVKDRNDDDIFDQWVSDTQVEFEFFETNNPNQPCFYINVLVDKNDKKSEPCLYSIEVEVISSRIPEFFLNLNELDCLNISEQTKNLEIKGKLSVRFAPRLRQIKLDIINNIKILGSNIINLVKIDEIDNFINYEFIFNIDILTYGKGTINATFITSSGSFLDAQINHNFFIIPNLQLLLNPTTTLPFTCSSSGNQNNNAPSTFIENQTITTTLDLELFNGFLYRFMFIYSIAEVILPNFCDNNDLDSISSYKEVLRINGNQMNGNSHTFVANLSPQQLNNLPRPFTYAIRLEARRTDINCSHIFNLKGWTVLPAPVICSTEIPHQTLEVEVI